MAKAQFKILFFLIALGIALGCMAMAYWIYDKVILRENNLRKEIATLKQVDRPVVDPGAKRFEAAADLIREGQFAEGREALYKLVQQFPDSPKCKEAKRIIGEMNMDELFSSQGPDKNDNTGRKDYIVQPGDSLLRIATNKNTTVDSLIRMNGLLSTTLQPGDHLTVVPMDFSVRVDLSEKHLSLWRRAGEKDYFFKEYATLDIRLPPGVRAPSEMEISSKSAVADGKIVQSTDPRYVEADKWLQGSLKGNRAGIIIRTQPPVKATPVAEAPPPPPTNTKGKAGKGNAKGAAVANQDVAAEPPPPETGVFLLDEDLEELFALVRKGSKLYFVR